ARASTAAAAALVGPEIGGRRRLAAGDREARNQHPGPGRLAGRADLSGVPLREPGQDFELAGAAFTPILVDGHLMDDSKLDELVSLIAAWPGLMARPDRALVDDGLVLLEYLGEARSLVDVGSGAGVPGIPIKMARPDLEVTLIEADQTKAAFLVHACAVLG